MQGMIIILVLAFLGFIGFCIYFIFKNLQFVIQATNLYKKILNREEVIIKVLLDIRDNTKVAQVDLAQLDQNNVQVLREKICPVCHRPGVYTDANGSQFCPQCKIVVDAAAVKNAIKSVPNSTVCPKCGKRYEGEDSGSFCEECGTRLG